MLELVAGVAVLSLVISIGLAFRVIRLELTRLPLPSEAGSPQPVPLLEEPSPLEGLRIALAVTQDHPHPIFEEMLKEQLLGEDVSEVRSLSSPEATTLPAGWPSSAEGPDILIQGALTCNGYAEVYYEADFTCSTSSQAICRLIARLKGELTKQTNRDERRLAIRELKGP